MVGFLIWLVFVILYVILKLPSILYTILIQEKGSKVFTRFNGYWYRSALSLDRYMNYDLKSLLNVLFIKKSSKFHFGYFEDTISYVLGVNQINNELTVAGKILTYLLWIFCPLRYWNVGHCKWAVLTKI